MAESEQRERKPRGKKGGKPAKKNHRPPAPLKPLKNLTNREHINVSCRFVVRQDSNITPATVDVEKPLLPSKIWRVFSPVQECPICLEEAEVPRMLNCGHIMCLNCMQQHRRLSKTPNLCAICGEPASSLLSATLAVTFLHCEPVFLPKENEEVVLTLMKRSNDSVVALPANLEQDNVLLNLDSFPSPNYILWTRLCTGNLDYACRELASDLKTLISAKNKCISEFGSDEGHLDAIADLKQYISTLKKQTETQQKEHKHHHESREGAGEPQFSYYYQTAFESSTLYTLSSLDVSILRAAFGSYENLPSSVVATVENIEYGIIDHTNDKRLKYLRHIPEQTAVAYLECDWRGTVSDEVLATFKSKLKERKQRKRNKIAKDIAEKQKAEEAIENQFKYEVSSALVPQAQQSRSFIKINPTELPSLPGTAPATEPPPPPVWIDPAKEREKILKNAYVVGQGKKKSLFLSL